MEYGCQPLCPELEVSNALDGHPFGVSGIAPYHRLFLINYLPHYSTGTAHRGAAALLAARREGWLRLRRVPADGGQGAAVPTDVTDFETAQALASQTVDGTPAWPPSPALLGLECLEEDREGADHADENKHRRDDEDCTGDSASPH